MKRIIFAFSLAAATLAALHSCIAINPTGYEFLSTEQRQKVVYPSKPLDQLTLCDTIYIVNDSVVRDFLKDKELTVVCNFLTWCTSEYCLSPDLILDQLQQSGLPYLMIAGDYYSLSGYNANYPFITIDSKYYKTHRYNRSIKRMFQALGCGEDWWYGYTIFRRGEYVGSGRSLEEALKFIEQ